jgi:hypothetical protein
MRVILVVMLMLLKSISFAQNIGIGTTTPTEKLDVANGNLRIRNINTNPGTVGVDKTVVADANGVLKTVAQGDYSLFYAKLTANQTLAPSVRTTLIYNTPLATSALYSYNTSTGELTFNQAGNYLITMQTGFSTPTADIQLLMGIRPVPDADYLARGSHYNAAITSAPIGELMQYITMLTVVAGAKVKFIAAPNAACTALVNETGSSGTGNVTNIAIQKI